MTSINWPLTLPQNANFGASCEIVGNTFSQVMSTGYDKRRPKTTSRYRKYTVEYGMTLLEYDAFQRFFHNELGYGEMSFNLPDPLRIQDPLEVRFIGEEAPFNVTPWAGTDQLLVSFTVQALEYITPGTVKDSWPLDLPSLPLHNAYSQSEQNALVSYNSPNFESRRRFTATTINHNMSYVLTREQLVIFEQFYADQGWGIMPFDLEAPLYTPSIIKVRFGSSYSISYDSDTLYYTLSVSVEEIPKFVKDLPITEVKRTSDNSTKITSNDDTKITSRS